MKRLVVAMLAMCSGLWLMAQTAVGPVLGPVSMRTAKLWAATESKTAIATVQVWAKGKPQQKQVVRTLPTDKNAPYHFQQFEVVNLEPATTYEYEVTLKDGPTHQPPVVMGKGSFTTQALFQWRSNAPDFSFIAGSCAYFNEPRFDRPGKPYGGDSSIFETMAKEQAAFMLWLGDNWYTRDVDYSNEWGMWYRAYRDRSSPSLKQLWANMPHLAIWDDHDYGPNDYGKSFQFKQTSREVFRHMWMNPTYGENNEGIYGKYTYADVDFFMMDDRWWRDFDELPDSINGKPNAYKRMYGKQQLEWLKNELRYSKNNPHISFRIIVTGSQVLNPGSPLDKLLDFPIEYNELMEFIKAEKIPGILFLTGDRHHTEIIKVQHAGLYPMYDITCSPLTSGTHAFGGKEANNPWRILGIDKLQNYGRISISGPRSKRVMKVEFLGVKGEALGQWQVGEQELRF